MNQRRTCRGHYRAREDRPSSTPTYQAALCELKATLQHDVWSGIDRAIDIQTRRSYSSDGVVLKVVHKSKLSNVPTDGGRYDNLIARHPPRCVCYGVQGEEHPQWARTLVSKMFLVTHRTDAFICYVVSEPNSAADCSVIAWTGRGWICRLRGLRTLPDYGCLAVEISPERHCTSGPWGLVTRSMFSTYRGPFEHPRRLSKSSYGSTAAKGTAPGDH